MTIDEIRMAACLYEQGLSLKDVATRLGYKSENTVRNAFKRNGIPIRSTAGFNNSVNHNTFDEINSEDKAYFVGMLLADGCVIERHRSQKQIALELKCEDKYIIEKLGKLMETTNKIYEARGTARLAVHSDNIAMKLAKYGITPRKTGKKIFQIMEIPKEYRRDFIRGFFDGNGWITYAKHGKHYMWSIGFADSQELLCDLNKYLYDNGIVKTRIKIVSHGGCHMLLFSAKRDVISLIHYLYDSSHIFLVRKYNKAISCMDNTEKG